MKSAESMQHLIEQGIIPKLYSLDLSKTIELSEFADSNSEYTAETLKFPVVVNGAVWAGMTKEPVNGEWDGKSDVFSGDGKVVGKLIRRKAFSVYNVGSSGLEGESYYHLNTIKKHQNNNISKEETKMSSELDKLAAGLNLSGAEPVSLDQLGGDTAPQAMNQFNEGAKEEGQASSGLKYELTSKIDKVELADAYGLQSFNRRLGRVIGYVTNTEARNEFVAVSEPLLENGRQVLLPTAPKEIQEQFARGDSVPKKYLQTTFRLNVRQAKPGKILGMILSIPAGGLVDMLAFRSGGTLNADESQKDLAYRILSKEVYPTFLDFYFGSKILELPETHGGQAAAGEITQRASLRTKTKDGHPTNQQVVSRFLKSSKRKSVLMATNYIPMKTYETIPVNGKLSEDDVKTLNESAFMSLISSKPQKDQQTNKFGLLAPEDKNKVTYNPATGEITSVFFTTDMNAREDIVVRPFYDKNGEPLPTVEIPVKERNVSASGSVSWRYKTISTVDQKVLESEDRNKTSLYSGKYKTLIDASNGAVNEEALRELVRRSKPAKKQPGLTNQELLKLQLGLAQNTISSEDLEFREGGSDYDAIRHALTDLRQGVSL